MSFSQFIKPYPDGYEDFEVGGTPVTAEILNTNYDGFLLGLNEFLPELAGMVEANPSESATAGNLTKLKVGNSIYLIPSGGSGGSTVEWEQLQLTGTKIATITIDNVPVDVYAPSGGGSGDEVEWTQVFGSGTEIGTITINGTPTTVYAPTPIDVEANPSGSATAGDLTKLKVGSSIYSIPSGGGGSSTLDGLNDVDIDDSTLADGQALVYNGIEEKWVNGQGGGGTGGHTIIDENGTSMTARSGLQFVGGANVSDDSTNNKTIVDLASAGGIDGVFIDTGNVIDSQSGTMVNGTPYEYTALEDCFVSIYTYSISNGKSWTIKLNNALTLFYEEITYSNMGKTVGFFVKKGDSLYISTNDTTSRSVSLEAYGIQTGTTHSKFQPVIYSLEEREIGVWTDGKPLYQKTFIWNPTSTETTIDVSSLNIDKLVKRQGTFTRNSSGTIQQKNLEYRTEDVSNNNYGIQCEIRSTNLLIRISAYTYSEITEVRVTLQYTKTTDVAGSGSWTPQGVPAIHYSTEEHIVGTWIDGSTIYEKTWDLTGISDNITVGDWTVVISNLTGIGKILDAKSLQNESVISFIEYSYDNANSRLMGKSLRYNTVDYVRYLTLQYTKSS